MDTAEEKPPLCVFQIVSSKTVTRPLELKKGKPAGKGTITVCTVCVCVCEIKNRSCNYLFFI